MTIVKYSTSLILLIFITIFSAHGQSDSSDSSFMDLSLEDLMNINITVASKKEEPVTEAPASITAYKAADLKRFGYYTLSDLANITSGYSSFSIYGEKVFETRGQKAGSFNNNKHLLLIDGIPVHHAKSYKGNTEEDLPLLFADRIEFLKGPASALYGVSAFYGVVNIVSQTPDKGGLANIKISGGNNDFTRRLMANTAYKTDNGIAKLSLGYFKKNASMEFVGVVNDSNNLYWDDQNSLFLNTSYKITSGVLNGITIGSIYIKKTGGLGEHWMHGNWSHAINELTWETFIPYIKYEKKVSDKLSFESYLKGNESVEKGFWAVTTTNPASDFFRHYNQTIHNLEFLGQMNYEFNSTMNLIAGVNIDSRYQLASPGSYSFIFNNSDSVAAGKIFVEDKSFEKPSDVFNTYSAFTQIRKRIDFLKGIIITAGFREDIGKTSYNQYSQFSPRVGVVQKVTDHLNIRLLYGKALRAPGIKEVELNRESAATLRNQGKSTDGIPQLKAETISSKEAGLTFANSVLVGSITYFNNRTENALDGTIYDGQNIFSNSTGNIKAQGIELDAQFSLSGKWKGMVNYSYAVAKDTSDFYLADVPVSKVNGAISYIVSQPLKVNSTIIGRYISGYRVAGADNSTISEHMIFDINLSAMVYKNIELEFMIRNVLNEKYKLPKSGMIDVPMPGRNYLISLDINF